MYFRISSYKLSFVLYILLFVILSIPFSTDAQSENITVLSVVPLFSTSEVFTDELYNAFEAEHPNVRVVTVENTLPMPIGYPQGNIQSYLNQMAQYASLGDVITVNDTLTPFATLAGTILDLAPLIAADSNFSPEETYPSKVWDTFQWDNGIWALPAASSITVLAYDPSKFDDKGLSYPQPSWTLEDYGNAARQLSEYDTDGKVKVPGLAYYTISPSRVITSLASGSLLDQNNLPQLDQSNLGSILSVWTTLTKEGVIAENLQNSSIDTPMYITDYIPANSTNGYVYTTLPGGHVWLDSTGFAVSRGTQYPDLAYELAKFLTQQLSVAIRYGNFPARLGFYNTVTPSNSTTLTNQNNVSYTLASQQLFNNLVDQSVLNSERLYSSYLHWAVVRSSPQSSIEFLREAQLQITKDLLSARNFYDKIQIVVNEPQAPPTPEAGKILLKFGINSSSANVPNKDLLEQLALDFVNNHQNVQQIDIESSSKGFTQLTESYDCFYTNENTTSENDLTDTINLDPLLEADADFLPNAFVGNMLDQLRYDGKIWAYPVGIQPIVLRYDPHVFDQYQLLPPQNEWDTSLFSETIRTIWEQNGRKSAVIKPFFASGNTYLLMLMASYGGLLFDYRTTPSTVDLTSQNNFVAIQTVLNLAREGIIGYIPLSSKSSSQILLDAPPMFIDALQTTIPVNYSSYEMVGFPKGSQYSPISYTVGKAYISKRSPAPELCYEWIKTLGQHPNLLNNFPVNLKISDIDIVNNQVGRNANAFYGEFISQLKAPNTILIPSITDSYENEWLNQVFDDYVLHNTDLVSELDKIQMRISLYRECITTTPKDKCAAMLN